MPNGRNVGQGVMESREEIVEGERRVIQVVKLDRRITLANMAAAAVTVVTLVFSIGTFVQSAKDLKEAVVGVRQELVEMKANQRATDDRQDADLKSVVVQFQASIDKLSDRLYELAKQNSERPHVR